MEDVLGSVGMVGRNPTASTTAPVVTVAVIAQTPGPWFEEVLTSLASQDYPRLRFFVLETNDRWADGGAALERRVNAILPDSQVILVNAAGGFAGAANEAIQLPGMSQFLLLCQDHVALAPDAISRLVEEALRSNAGVLGPKLVDWEDPRRLREVGVAVDKLGVVAPYAEDGEFDQEQHDAVRDVFAVAGATMLLRSDLFAALGGFDPGMPHLGYDIDLCWRAHVAGARVMVVPNAVARCGPEFVNRADDIDLDGQEEASQVRSLLSNYSVAHSLRVVPQAMVVSAVSAFAAVAGGRFGDARRIVAAWLTNLVDIRSILARRRELHRVRGLGDAEVRRFQVRGFEHVNRRLRERGDVDSTGRPSRFNRVTNQAKSREIQASIVVWSLVFVTVVFGSRRMFGEHVPVINEFGAFSAGPLDLLRGWFSSYRPGGFGTEGYAPTLDLVTALLGFVTFGQMGLLRALLTIGMILLGALGMYRLIAPFQSLVAKLAAPLVYAAVPLGYNALVSGSWRALVLIGGLPWILKWLTTAAGISPFAPPRSAWKWARDSLVAAVWVALVGTWAPAVVGAVAVLVLGVSLGGVLTGRPGPIWRLVLSGIFAVAGAFVLHLPWSAELIKDGDLWGVLTDGRSTTHGDLSIASLLRFETGPHGAVPLGWALIVLGGLSLLLSRSGRLVWAVRGWMIAILSFGLAWVGQQGELGFPLPETELLLAPAALGIALAASMGVLSFERDLRVYGFGWRQTLPAVASVALLASFLGGLGSTFNGRWETPRNGFEIATLFLADGNEGRSRVLWLGDADVLPAGSTEFVDEMALAVTPARTPDVQDLFPAALGPAGDDLDAALDIALRGGTSRLGSLLGPLGLRYVIVVERIAPPYETALAPASPRVLDMLAEQLDLEETEVRVGMRVFKNTAWVPTLASFPAGSLMSEDAPKSIFDRGWSPGDATSALTASGSETYVGRVQSDSDLFFAVNASERWKLRVGNKSMVRTRAFGWANGFSIPAGGTAELQHSTPVTHRLALGGQLVLWSGVVVVILAGRRRT